MGDHPTNQLHSGRTIYLRGARSHLGAMLQFRLLSFERSLHFKPFQSLVVAVKSIRIMESLKFDLHWKSPSGFMEDSSFFMSLKYYLQDGVLPCYKLAYLVGEEVL